MIKNFNCVGRFIIPKVGLNFIPQSSSARHYTTSARNILEAKTRERSPFHEVELTATGVGNFGIGSQLAFSIEPLLLTNMLFDDSTCGVGVRIRLENDIILRGSGRFL